MIQQAVFRSGMSGRAAAAVLLATTLLATAPRAFAVTEIGEIVVTARKIEERLKEVPLAITAFSAEEIESAGISSLEDLADQTPGLQFINAIGEFLPVPVIRGVAPTDIRGENNTAIFVDGVFVAGREGLNFSQLDVERIEVVKGPQSALYGRSAFSGAINYITRRPTGEFEARSELTAGNDGRMLAKGSVGGGLIDGLLSGRFGALYDEWDGSYENPLPGGGDVGGYRYRTFQGSLLLTPGDDVEALLTGYYSNDDIDESATTSLQANCEDDALFDPSFQDDLGVPVGEHLSNFCGQVPSLSGDDIPKIAEALGENREVKRASLNVDWDLGVGTLSLLTGYTNTEQDSLTDFSRDFGYGMPFNYCTGALVLGVFCQDAELSRFFAGVLNVENGAETEEWSQEIRYTSALDRSVRYSIGAYFYDETLDERNGYPLILGGAPADLTLWCPCQAVGVTQLAPFGSFIFGPSTAAEPEILESVTETRAWAGFSWAEWDFAERFTARVELRYTNEDKDLEVLGSELASDDWGAWTGRLGLKYQVNERWMTYAYVANAKKSGGFDNDVIDLVNPDQDPNDPNDDVITDVPVVIAFDPEENITYELGAKGTTSDGRVGIDLALYRIDWDEIVLPQVFTSIDGNLIAGGAISLRDNSGDATVWGWEAGTDIRFSDVLSGRFGVSFTDASWDNARIASFQYFPSFEPDGDVSGNEMLRQSPWSVTGSLRYRRPIGGGDWEYFNRLDVSWRDGWYVGNDNQSRIPSRTNVNLRIGVESGRYAVELWGDNILDDDTPASAFRDIYWTNTADLAAADNPPQSTLAEFPVLRLTVNQPRLRTFGLSARVRFGGAER